MSRARSLVLVTVLLLGLAWVAFFWNPQPERASPNQGLDLAEVPKGGDFVLRSYRGPVALKDLRGKVVVLYFGYTWCPDICPTNLGYLALALNELTPGELAQVRSLFVSVDPERDSLERLKSYGEYFHPDILGITGTPEEVARVAALYGAAYHRTQVDSAMDYVVDHSAYTYVIDRNGKLYRTLPHGTPPQQIVQVLRAALDE